MLKFSISAISHLLIKYTILLSDLDPLPQDFIASNEVLAKIIAYNEMLHQASSLTDILAIAVIYNKYRALLCQVLDEEPEYMDKLLPNRMIELSFPSLFTITKEFINKNPSIKNSTPKKLPDEVFERLNKPNIFIKFPYFAYTKSHFNLECITYDSYINNEASFNFNINTIISQLAFNDDVYCGDIEFGRTILHFAAQYNLPEVVEQLINESHDLSVTDSIGNTVLHYASAGGNKMIIEMILARQPNLKYQANEFGQTIIFSALHSEDNEIIDWLIEEQEFDINSRDYNDDSLLHYGARLLKIESVRYLLNRYSALRANINSQNVKGKTPLLLAIERMGDLINEDVTSDMAEILLTYGASISIQSFNGLSPRSYIIGNGTYSSTTRKLLYNPKFQDLYLASNLFTRLSHPQVWGLWGLAVLYWIGFGSFEYYIEYSNPRNNLWHLLRDFVFGIGIFFIASSLVMLPRSKLQDINTLFLISIDYLRDIYNFITEAITPAKSVPEEKHMKFEEQNATILETKLASINSAALLCYRNPFTLFGQSDSVLEQVQSMQSDKKVLYDTDFLSIKKIK